MMYVRYLNRKTLVCSALILVATMVEPVQRAVGQDEAEILERTSKAFTTIAKEAVPAVVFIEVEKAVEMGQRMPPMFFNNPFDLFGEEFRERFFRYGQPQERSPQRKFRQQGQGSGFLISEDGYILTNNHVVGDVDKITVTLSDGRTFEAELVGTDPHSEVALIRIEGNDLPSLELGDSSDLEIGEWVIAIGNPFGLVETVTVGVVSAKGRSNIGITDYENFIQTDAAINPGNSGGPLLNIHGEVVGVNTAIFSQSGGYMGIGFAIPINMAKAIKQQLIETGKVVRGYLGIQIQQLTPELATSFATEVDKGVLVAQVLEDTPAEKAGLLPGDIVIEMEGEAVEDVGRFRNRVAARSPGTEITLGILRNGKKMAVAVTMESLPADLASAAQPQRADDTIEKLGMDVQALTPELARRFNYEQEEGVIVSNVDPGSLAWDAGIRAGNLIASVNMEPVSTVDAFRNALNESAAAGRVLLLVKDPRGAHFVSIRLEE